MGLLQLEQCAVGRVMKAIGRTATLGVLILLVAGAAAAQPAGSPRPPSVPPSPDVRVSPPGIQRLEIRPDTPAERDAFLARRRAAMERQKIETVAPLPAQRITPSSQVPAPQQR
jgi:hypothetical protein